MTREQTYSQLLTNVSESEAKIDVLKKDNDELSSRLHELRVSQADASDNKDKTDVKDTMQNDEEIYNMQQELESTNRDFTTLKERFKKMNIVND